VLLDCDAGLLGFRIVPTTQRRLSTWTVICLVGATSGAAVMASCSNDDPAGTVGTAATTTTVAVVAPRSDNQLTIGVMLPPAASLLRDSISSGAQEAVDRINQAGGVFGEAVKMITADEGDNAATGSAAVQTLLTRNVDAIVGPTSSLIALATLSRIVSSNVVACSPTASALALDNFPDGGRFLRTIPSDSMEARAIGQVAQQTGVQSVVVVDVNDAYGRPLRDAVTSVLASKSITIADSVGITSGATKLDDAVQEVIDSGASVIVLLADSADGAQFLESLSSSGTKRFSAIIVGDPLRAAGAQRIAALRPDVRRIVLGVAPQAQSTDAKSPFDPPGPFATNAFDCVNLIALAALQARSDRAADVAAQVASVSSGGQGCRTFADCANAIAAGLQIDYDGPSGITEISGSTGDPTRGRFDLFTFDDAGDAVDASTLVVES
jgi:branched-chain amino acid transport system substrate-binding protein